MDVGFDEFGLPAKNASRVLPGKGDDARVDGEEADRYADNVNEFSSEAVASLDSRSSP